MFNKLLSVSYVYGMLYERLGQLASMVAGLMRVLHAELFLTLDLGVSRRWQETQRQLLTFRTLRKWEEI